MTNVYQAWAQVMGDVQGIRKSERNSAQGFNFRGIDQVLNTVGPVLRKHGVVVFPIAEDVEQERYTTAKGGVMHSVVVRVRFVVVGPDGDQFEGVSFGQAADSGDKAVSKAQSVAYRTFLLQSLTVPTDDRDPDADSHVRTSAPSPADQARAQLRRICQTKKIPLRDAGDTFKVRTGTDLNTTDDVAAINSLISHYGEK